MLIEGGFDLCFVRTFFVICLIKGSGFKVNRLVLKVGTL